MPSTLSNRSMSPEESLYLFHHVFLPPKLPQEDDYDPGCEMFLLDMVINALGEFRDQVTSQPAGIVTAVITMVTRLRGICGFHGDVNEVELKKALVQLAIEGKHACSRRIPRIFCQYQLQADSFLFIFAVRMLQF